MRGEEVVTREAQVGRKGREERQEGLRAGMKRGRGRGREGGKSRPQSHF